MTAKQVFEYALVELNKKDAPSLLLEDYNYFINKAANQYINKMYNAYDVNQQKTDDLRVLKSSAVLIPSQSSNWSASNLLNNTYEVDLPDDYLHILNCVVEYTVLKNYKCYNAGTPWQQGAKRITADMWSQLIHNYYLRPSYKNPYFYINNITTDSIFPTADNQVSIATKTTIVLDEIGDIVPNDTITINGVTYTFKTTPTLPFGVKCSYGAVTEYSSLTYLKFKLLESTDPVITRNTYSGSLIISGYELTVTHTCGGDVDVVTTSGNDLVQRSEDIRYGNKSKIRMEIRYGKDSSTFGLSKVYIDYLKTPQFIRLTQDEIDEVEDTSQILEFPDYVCQEIVNELVKLLMENSSDPRLQTNIPINQSIASPQAQQEAPRKR